MYALFGIAVERPVVEGDWHGKRETIFYDVVCFGTLAGNATASLKKGTRAIVVGRTETRAYETGDGEIRDVVRIVANAVGPELRWAKATVRKVRSAPARPRRPRKPAREPRPNEQPDSGARNPNAANRQSPGRNA